MTWMLDVTNFRKADERLRVMIDATPLAVTFWDDEFRLLDCNAGAPALYGLPDKATYLARFHELLPPCQPDGGDSRKAVEARLRRAADEGRCVFEWMHQKLDGTPMPSEVTLVRMPFGDRWVVVGFVRDLRDVKACEAEVLRAKDRLGAMLDAVPLAVTCWDRDGQCVDCNAEALRLFRVPDRPIYLGRFHELAPPVQPDGRASEAAAREYIRRAFEEGRIRFAWTHRNLDGIEFVAEVTLQRMAFEDGYVVVSFARALRKEGAL